MKKLHNTTLSILTALIAASCSTKPGDLVQPKIDNSISTTDLAISVTKNNVAADNYSTGQITAQIKNPLLLNAGTTITFTCDKGSFANGTNTYTVTAGSDGITTAEIKDSKAEAVDVTVAMAGGFSSTLAVNFVPALPDQILLEPDNAILTDAASTKTNITATLIRVNGMPTQNQALTFTDSTSVGGKSIGVFLNSTLSDANGKISTEYFVQDTTYKGYVYLKGYLGPGAKMPSGTTRILIQK